MSTNKKNHRQKTVHTDILEDDISSHESQSSSPHPNHLGNILKTKREAKGLSIEELAQQFNGNHIKWRNKIQSWEDGTLIPKGRYKKQICRALNITSAEWKQQIKQILDKPEVSVEHLNIPDQNRYRIAKYQEILIAHRHEILSNPEWRNIFLSGFSMGTMYFGGCASMKLGAILELWSNGHFISTKEDTFYVLHGGGSPLSGWQQFYGFRAGTTNIEKRGQVFYPLMEKVQVVIQLLAQKYNGLSAWSLPQLLAHFQAPIPCATIYNEGKIWGSYDFQNKTLVTPYGEERFNFHPYEHHKTERLEEEEFGPSHSGNTPILHNLATMQLGEWLGEKWVMQDSHKNPWIIRCDGIEAPNGNKELSWDNDIPPLVAERIFRIHTKETEPK